jgi:DNA polymerase-1
MGGGLTSGEIMVVGDVTTYGEDEANATFLTSSPAVKFLLIKLRDAGVKVDYWTKAVKCYPGYEGKTTAKQISTCAKTHLAGEIERVRPKYILALGDAALKALCGGGGITKKRGEFHPLKLKLGDASLQESIQVFPIYSPSYVLRKPGEEAAFTEDMAYFAGAIKGKHKPPSDLKWTYVEDADDLSILEEAYETCETYMVYDIENSDERTKEQLEFFDADKPARPHQGKLTMIGFGFDGKHIFVVPWEHKQGPAGTNSLWSMLVTALVRRILKDPKLKKAPYNGKYDNRWLRGRAGVEPYQTFDPYLANCLLDENRRNGLKHHAKAHYGAQDYGKNIRYDEDYPIMDLAYYLALDIYYNMKEYERTREEILKDAGLTKVMAHIIMPASRMLERIEQKGVWVHEDKLHEAGVQLEARIKDSLGKLETLSPIEGVNWNSSQQKAEVFFGSKGFGLDPIKMTEADAASTDKETLITIAAESNVKEAAELAAILREYNLARDRLKFVTAWKGFVQDSKAAFGVPRIFPLYNLGSVKTGRLSSEEPNFQQIPRDALLRSIFGAPPGRVFLEADGKQMELCIGAHCAQEMTMIDLIRRNEDLHKHTVWGITGTPKGSITKEQRQGGKASNFGLLYGQQWRGYKRFSYLQYGVKLTDEEAKANRAGWFKLYSGIAPWHQRCRNTISTLGYIRSATGRYRRLPNVWSPDEAIREEAIREGTNFEVQSFANDIIVLAAGEVDRYHQERARPKFDLIGLIHDAIALEVDEDAVDVVATLVKNSIEWAVPSVILPKKFNVHLSVPLTAEIEVGPSWGEAVEWHP